MKKISNQQSMVLTGPKLKSAVINKEKQQAGSFNNKGSNKMQTNQNIKQSLSQIQQLSREIDIQFEQNNKKYSQNKNKCVQYKDENIIYTNRYFGNDENEKYQQNRQIDENDFIEQSIRQYFALNLLSTIINEQLSQEEFQQYKRVRVKNVDFVEIVNKLEKLRRVQLSGSNKNGNINQVVQLESDAVRQIVTVAQLQSNRKQDSQQDEPVQQNEKLLQCIQRLQLMKHTIQQRMQQLGDDIGYKKSIINQLQANKQNILDEMEILQSRNSNLRRQLQQYGQNSIGENQEQMKQQQEDNRQEDDSDQQQSQEQDSQQYQGKQNNDCQRQYIQLMTMYQLYDPTDNKQHFIGHFPKNKTETIMLLNQINSKITKLQLKQTLSLIEL